MPKGVEHHGPSILQDAVDLGNCGYFETVRVNFQATISTRFRSDKPRDRTTIVAPPRGVPGSRSPARWWLCSIWLPPLVHLLRQFLQLLDFLAGEVGCFLGIVHNSIEFWRLPWFVGRIGENDFPFTIHQPTPPNVLFRSIDVDCVVRETCSLE